MVGILLSTAYFAPVQYYAKIITSEKVTIEVHENYSKQSYRNRCNIFGPNGIQSLCIPVTKGSKNKINVREVQIDYSTKWQKIHFKAIESAYRNSPYYDYFIDDIAPFFQRHYLYLFDFNIEIQNVITTILGLQLEVLFTEKYMNQSFSDKHDFRDRIHPKKVIEDPDFVIVPYNQVFSVKYGFIPNLSIIDLLFNEGLDALTILKKSCKYDNVMM